jgi:hypothetical protein
VLAVDSEESRRLLPESPVTVAGGLGSIPTATLVEVDGEGDGRNPSHKPNVDVDPKART